MEHSDIANLRHDTIPDHQHVIRAIEPAVARHLSLLLPLDRAWQPTEYLPDLETVDWRDEVERFRTAAEAVSDELLVVLAGDMITEEALRVGRHWRCALSRGAKRCRARQTATAGVQLDSRPNGVSRQ